jgi:hypothetical protein
MQLSLQNEIHLLRAERDEYEASVLNLNRELGITRDKLQQVEEESRTAASRSEKLQKEKAEADKEVKKLQQTVTEGSKLAAELAHLKQQLAQSTIDCQLKEQKLLDLRNEHMVLKGKMTTSQEEKIRMESKLAKMLIKIGDIQKSLDARVEAHEKDVATMQELRNQAASWQKEKETSNSSVEKSRIAESKFNVAQTRFATEKGSLKTQLAELRTMVETTEQEIQCTRHDTEEQIKRAKKTHEIEANGLKHRLTIAETAVEEANARAQPITDEKARQFEDQKRTTGGKGEDLVREKMATDQREHHRQGDLHQSGVQFDVPQHSSTTANLPVDESLSVRIGRPGGKVIRQNSTVLNVMGTPRLHPVPVPTRPHPPQSRIDEHEDMVDIDDQDRLDMTGDPRSREPLDENGIAVLDPTADVEVDTQKTLTMSFGRFKIKMNQEPQSPMSRTSSSLSDPPSSDIIAMDEPEPPMAFTIDPEIHTENPCAITMLPPRGRFLETSSCALDQFGQGLSGYQSQDCSKSQANTALKIAPPVPSSEHSPSSHLNTSKRIITRSQTPKNDGMALKSDASSSDHDHRQPSVYKNHEQHATAQSFQHNTTSQTQVQECFRKRKSSESPVKDRASSKRQRSSSHSLPTEVISKTNRRSKSKSGTTTRQHKYNTAQTSRAQGISPSRSGEQTHHPSSGPRRGKRRVSYLLSSPIYY